MRFLSNCSFLVHQGSTQSPSVVDGFLQDTRNDHPDWHVGATVWLPRSSQDAAPAIASRYSDFANYVIADPETGRIDPESDLPRKGSKAGPDYLGIKLDDSNVEFFTEAVLRAQVDARCKVLVSPDVLIRQADQNSRSLQISLSLAQLAISHKYSAKRNLLIGVHVDESVVESEQARNYLLNQLVELPSRAVYLRVRMGSVPDGRKQYSKRRAIAGIRKIVESLAENERQVILPQFAMAGWLMLGFGAKAFGAGVNASMQRNVAPAGGGGANARPLSWYFLPQFLGFVLVEELAELRRVDGFESCTCPYCKKSPPRGGPDFDSESAGLHFLWWCACLANQFNVPRANPAKIVRARLEASQAFWKRVQVAAVALDLRSQPTHLEAWIAEAG